MATKKKLLQAAAGAAGGAGLNVEEVFSTYLYDGTGAAQTITNDIDLDGEGGMVWLKSRTSAGSSNIYGNHRLYDTERGVLKSLLPDQTTDETPLSPGGLTAFNSNGFTLGSNVRGNNSGTDYASWTFRKAPKFFDVVTYTGDGVSGRTVSHNLGSVPGCIIIKQTNTVRNWAVYHSGTGNTKQLELNTTDAAATDTHWNNTTPTSTEFTLGVNTRVNESGGTYVAYLFAHNDGDGDFGDGTQDIIKCGSYTGNGSTTGPVIDLGFEPQWILLKGASAASSWILYDTMRGMTVGTTNAGPDANLYPHSSAAEYTDYHLSPTPTGFQIRDTGGNTNTNGNTYIYMAIRRGPMAVPESATDVFDITTRDATHPSFDASFDVVDAAINRNTSGAFNWFAYARLIGTKYLNPNLTNAETTGASIEWDYMDGWSNGSGTNADLYSWMWKRAPNFFDVVAYTGNGTSGRTISHNLGVAPEMMWVKGRSNTDNWSVYHKDLSSGQYLQLNATAAAGTNSNMFTTTAPTSSVFSLGSDGAVNGSSNTYIAYLFASLDGVSKVGSITGTGSDQTIDCGFTSGARFVLIKRTSSTSNWWLFDTERGIAVGNDPMLRLDTTEAEASSDIIDPHSSGFTIKSTFAASGVELIFYAIA